MNCIICGGRTIPRNANLLDISSQIDKTRERLVLPARVKQQSPKYKHSCVFLWFSPRIAKSLYVLTFRAGSITSGGSSFYLGQRQSSLTFVHHGRIHPRHHSEDGLSVVEQNCRFPYTEGLKTLWGLAERIVFCSYNFVHRGRIS